MGLNVYFLQSNSPNASVAVTVVAGGPSGAVAVSTTASTAAATTATSVGVTGLCSMSVCFVSRLPRGKAYRGCGWRDGQRGDHRRASRSGCWWQL